METAIDVVDALGVCFLVTDQRIVFGAERFMVGLFSLAGEEAFRLDPDLIHTTKSP
ncbi:MULTISPECIES: hypothetical protein [unclassified Bradyrhizobium]